MNIGQKVRSARERAGISQEALASRVGISQASIDKIERGVTKNSRHLLSIVHHLGMPLTDLEGLYNKPVAAEAPTLAEPAPLPGRQPLNGVIPVYGAIEGRRGEIVRTHEPIDVTKRPSPLEFVKDSYGLVAAGVSMSPVVRPGDMLLVHPHIAPRQGDIVILYQGEPADGRLAVREYVCHDTAHWTVREYQPKQRESELSRDEWAACHVVVCRYLR